MFLHAGRTQISPDGPARTSLQFAWLLALCVGSPTSCAKAESVATPPTAAFGQSTPAQLALRHLEQSWREGRDREKQLLEPQLRAFIATYPSDPETRQAMLWLGWIHIDKKQYDEAIALANQASVDREGSIADAARVLRAAVYTRRGQAERALRLLEPLSGMIVDPLERDNWAREITRATLQLRHYDDALKWALVWRLECSEDRRASVEREITSLLDKVSRAAIERLWVQLEIALQLPTSIPGRKQARTWMRSAVTERLARYAIFNQDASLAQRLLYDPSVSLQRNVSLKRLARIAARAETENQSVGRKIGIVLDLDDPQQRRRSSEMVTGILQTLDELSEKSRAQLLTREASRSESNGYEDAVNDLYNEGVAIIIGGFDSTTATELVIRARTRGVPVLTLAPFGPAERGDRAFYIDTTDTSATDAWHQYIKTDINVLQITDTDPFCADAGIPPFDTWQSSHVQRVYFVAGSACAEKYGYAASQRTRLPEIWLGPKALAGADAWQSVPIEGFVNFEPIALPLHAEPSLTVWHQRFSRLPHYFEALGHDATVLIVGALNGVANLTTSNTASARDAVLAQVSRELLRARATLWSSNARGLSDGHALVPSFVVRTGSPNTAPAAARLEKP